jgi:outer membrane protein assembly factor BamB
VTVGGRPPHRNLRPPYNAAWALAVCLVVVLPTAAVALAGTTNASPRGGLNYSVTGTRAAGPASLTGTPGGTSAFDWPEFHQTPLLTGYAANSPLSTSNAGELGVAWASELYGAALDSPVVAYDATIGETLAYIGTENGYVVAVNLATGQILWGAWLGSAVRSTPLVHDGSLYVGTDGTPTLYKLNATTGSLECSAGSPMPIEGTPTIATPPGGVTTLYVGTNDAATSGPLLAMNAADCAYEWQFTGYAQTSGSWTGAAYAVDATGVPLVVFGTADPDSAVYALNAVTGKEVWRFQTLNPNKGTYDVGAGAVISPPGTNGFADGVAYVDNKDGIMYAIDLTTGKQIWSTNFNTLGKTHGEARSTAALDGTNLVFGYSRGVFDLNAVTGKEIWNFVDTGKAEALSSPAIAGASGQEIVVVGDLTGGIDVLSLATGKQLYRYQTGSYITASPAISDGNILIASADDFLYDLAVGGGNAASLPTTTITSPAASSTLPNPDGALTVTGSATDTPGVAAVMVAVQSDGPVGPWWDAASDSWSSGPVDNPATLADAGASTTSWQFAYPVPAAGGSYVLSAYATSTLGQSDIKGAQAGFVVKYSTTGPYLVASSAYVAPGGTVALNGGGFDAGELVTITMGSNPLATTTASPNGSISVASVPIPASAGFGQTSLVATGQTSLTSATVAVAVENSWLELGYNATHAGYEPNDPTLNDHVQLGSGAPWLKLSWHFVSSASLLASPVVADGVVYLGDSAGDLYALETANGGVIWSATIPGGGGIEGSPAVDPALGELIVSTSKGSVDAFSTANGGALWSAAVGGTPSAPVYGSGETFVASSNDRVFALSESTGSLTWSTTLAGPLDAAPALDASADLLVVSAANSAGDLFALNAMTGKTVWTFATGGAVTASATIASGMVFVGSANHDVFGIHEATGKKAWTYRTGGTVTATGALVSRGGTLPVSEYLVGASNGDVYELLQSSGAQKTEIPLGHGAISGVAGVAGIILMETVSGDTSAARSYVDLDLWTVTNGAGAFGEPVVVDGTVLVVGDSNLYAYTTFGQPPD